MDLKNIVSYVQNPMISINEALLKIRRIVAHTHERNCDVVKINNAHGRILFETVYANCNVPAFRVSTKNGYAILANDGEGVRTVLIKTTVSCDVRRSYIVTSYNYKTKIFCSLIQYLSNLGLV